MLLKDGFGFKQGDDRAAAFLKNNLDLASLVRQHLPGGTVSQRWASVVVDSPITCSRHLHAITFQYYLVRCRAELALMAQCPTAMAPTAPDPTHTIEFDADTVSAMIAGPFHTVCLSGSPIVGNSARTNEQDTTQCMRNMILESVSHFHAVHVTTFSLTGYENVAEFKEVLTSAEGVPATFELASALIQHFCRVVKTPVLLWTPSLDRPIMYRKPALPGIEAPPLLQDIILRCWVGRLAAFTLSLCGAGRCWETHFPKSLPSALLPRQQYLVIGRRL